MDNSNTPTDMRFLRSVRSSDARRGATVLSVLRVTALCLAQPVAAQFPATTSPGTSPFAYDVRTPPAWRDSLIRRADGVEEYAISFASPLGGRVTGKMIRLECSGRHFASAVAYA